jgi:tRNA A37 threonylcarbamoyladenosine modification protein TsaB
VYTGVYRFEDHKLVTVIDQEAASITELMEQLEALGEPVTFLGDGVPVFREQILEGMTLPVSFAPSHVSRQRAGAVAALGALYYKEGKIQSATEHTPEYLRVSQAERERAEREKKA